MASLKSKTAAIVGKAAEIVLSPAASLLEPLKDKAEEIVKDEVVSLAKKEAVTLLNKLYTTFSSQIVAMKTHPALVQHAVKYFDTGYLWLKEAILVHDDSVPAPEAPAESPPDGA